MTLFLMDDEYFSTSFMNISQILSLKTGTFVFLPYSSFAMVILDSKHLFNVFPQIGHGKQVL